jgi:ELWxxDGT repeat protein
LHEFVYLVAAISGVCTGFSSCFGEVLANVATSVLIAVWGVWFTVTAAFSQIAPALFHDTCSGTCNSNPSWLTSYAGTVFMASNPDPSTLGNELYKISGSSVVLVQDIYPGQHGSNPSYLTPFAGALYFQARTGALGAELFYTTGSTVTLRCR